MSTDASVDAPAPASGGVPRALVLVLAVVAVIALVAAAVTGVVAFTRRGSALGGLSTPQQQAVDAARAEMLLTQTFRRATFEQDVAAALAGMTADQGRQITEGKKVLLDTLTKNKFDTGARVLGSGLISFSGSTAEVLLAVDTLQTDDKATVLNSKPNAFQMTMTRTNGKWLMSNLVPVVYG